MRRQLLNCQSNWHWAKGIKNEAELRSDALKIDATQKILTNFHENLRFTWFGMAIELL